MSKRVHLDRRRLLGIAALMAPGALLAFADGAAPADAASGQASPAPSPITALLVSATNAPMGVLGSDGMEHLEYDLVITNVFSAPVTITAIDMLAPDGRLLLRLDGDTLAASTQPIFFIGGPPVHEVPVAGTVATVIDLVVPPGQAPARIRHRITYTFAADAPFQTIIAALEIDGPELTVDPRRTLAIAPPLRGNGWFNVNAPGSVDAPHRFFRLAIDGSHSVKPEMFAIDWVQLRDGLPFDGDGSRNEQYYGFGAEVYSVAAGTVVFTRDDMPNETPNQPPVAVHHPSDYGGNLVAVEIAPGVFAAYGHLQPGSVAVRRAISR